MTTKTTSRQDDSLKFFDDQRDNVVKTANINIVSVIKANIPRAVYTSHITLSTIYSNFFWAGRHNMNFTIYSSNLSSLNIK